MHRRLFEEAFIGPMRLKNRLLMAPMVRNWGEADGRSTPRYEAHIESVARGGVGAIIIEASFVSPEGRGFTRQLGLHDDAVIPSFARLVQAAHRHGARIGVQLYHAGRQTHAALTGMPLVGATTLPCPLGQEPVEALAEAGIARIVACFGDAARRAVAAGFDFVEIHGAHGYLVTQFLSPFSNTRSDGYGGSADGRFRFLGEVFGAVRGAVGPDFPVTVRLSGDEMVDGGLSIEDTVDIAQRLERLGAAAIHVSAGNYASYALGRMIPPMAVPDAPNAGLAERVKAGIDIPVITVGKIRGPELAERLIDQNVCDFVALGRPLLADPNWPHRAFDDGMAIDLCVACNEGCIGRLFRNEDVWCAVNPRAGREAEFAAADGTGVRKVVVVGGGPAGMTAATTAESFGHRVVLFEREESLGGQLHAAEAAPHRTGWTELRRALSATVLRSQVEVRLGVPATRAAIEAENPDVVILAAGAGPKPAAWPVAAGIAVVSGPQALADPRAVDGPVVVAGGGCSGAQTAEALAELGMDVTAVELGDSVAADAPLDDRSLLLERLRRLNVRLMTGTRILSASAGAVQILGAHGESALPARTLVLCHGSRSETGLTAGLESLGARLVVIGDCRSPRRVMDAILEGARAGAFLRQPALES